MQHVDVARAFFEAHLPSHVAKRVDLSTLKIEPNSYIDKKHKELISDILYSVQIDTQLGYIYILTEHQSKPEPLMPYRSLKYLFGIFDHHLKQQSGQLQHKRLPLILPLIVYNGQISPYPYSTDFYDLFTNPALAKEVMFNGPFKLVDLTAEPDESLRRHKEAAVMELLEKHIRARDILPIIKLLATSGLLAQLQHLGAGEYLEFALDYVLTKGEASDRSQVIDVLSETLPEQREKIMTIAEGLKQDGAKAARFDMAKNLLAMKKLSSDEIAKVSGLSLTDIKKLQTKH
jgi:predicted transposase/invertase (TIGR01784 family)